MNVNIKRIITNLGLIFILGNIFGGIGIFTYKNYIDIRFTEAPPEAVSQAADLGFFVGFTVVVLGGAILYSLWWGAPLLQLLRQVDQGQPPTTVPDTIKQRALAFPLALAGVSAFLWVLAGFFFPLVGALYETIDWVSLFWRSFIPITIISGVPSVIFIYLLLDLSWRPAIPLFFPDGDAPRYTTARLTIRKRLFLILPIITYLPLMMMMGIAYDRANSIVETGNPTYLDNMLLSYIYVGVLMVLVIELGAYSLLQSTVKPLRQLQQAFEQVGQHNDLTVRVPVVSNDELGGVAEGFNNMVEGLARAHKAEEEQARIAQELELARRTQLSMLPRESPKLAYLDIAASSEPARQVGGDLYGYYMLGNNTLAITLGDVSGKGITAALMMAATTGLLGAHVSLMDYPTDLLARLNIEIGFHTQQNKLNTALCVLHLATNGTGVKVEAANAGCVWPILRRANGEVEWFEIGGPPLGIASLDYSYSSLIRTLQPDDLLILSSDGVIEAHNPQRELFGLNRLETAVANMDPTQPASMLHNNLLQTVHAFTRGLELHDDLTLVVLKVI